MENTSEIHALIQLLDDSDKEVFRHVHDRLIGYGPGIIPFLEEAWHKDMNPVIHERLEEIIREIQFSALEEEWKNWLLQKQPDLLTGTWLVARLHYPDLKLDELLKKLNKIRQTIWLELNYNQTALEQIHVFNQVFYGYHKFSGDHSPVEFNAYCINNVLEKKHGSVIMLGIVYQILANDLNLPVYGVPLLRHYVLAFCKHTILDFRQEEVSEREVMFYINPLNNGIIFSRNEIKEYLEKIGEDIKPVYFQPGTAIAIVRELIAYLMEIHSQKNEGDYMKNLLQLYRHTENHNNA